MTDYDILGFDSDNAVRVHSTEEMRIVVRFAEDNGHHDYCVDDGDYEAERYPFICLLDSDHSELNAFAEEEAGRFDSISEFDDWYSTYIENQTPNLNIESLNSLL